MNNSKNRILIVLVIFLLLTNIAMLLYFTVFDKTDGKPPRGGDRRGSGITFFLQNDLKFSKEQMDMVDSLKKQHRTAMKPLFDELGRSKDSFYHLLGQPGLNDSLLQVSALQIGKNQAALDLQFFQNFMSFRKLCTADQLPKFDSAMPVLSSKLMQPWKNNGPHRKDSIQAKN